MKKFKVNIDRVHYLVHVWPTKKKMLDGRVKRKLSRHSCYAYTLTYPKHRKTKIGEIHFYQSILKHNQAGPSLIAHESLHAALAFMRLGGEDLSKLKYDNRKKSTDKDTEEVLARIVDGLVYKITTNIYN